MKLISLTQGFSAKVDDDDFEVLNQWKWYALKSGRGIYAIRAGPRNSAGRKPFRMHREIINAPAGVEVDHRDGDGLNNQKDNLRIASRAQNVYNSKKSLNSLSKFKGVTLHKRSRKWQSAIWKAGRYRYLGSFDSEMDAAKAYDEAAKICFREFARLNFQRAV